MKKTKILLLSDDIRIKTGVGTQALELILNTIDNIDWVQISGGFVKQHPDNNKIIDLSEQLKTEFNKEGYLKLYPSNDYGNPNHLLQVIEMEKPDAILLFTDPKFWGWLWNLENDIRKHIPILYWHVWDNYPSPDYNKSFYLSCDGIYCISKLTYNIVKDVIKDNEIQLKYLPHGVNTNIYKPIQEVNKLFPQFDFIVLYNNRNIYRKHPSDVILGFENFIKSIKPENRNKCLLVMKTQPIDRNGTNLLDVKEKMAPLCNIAFIDKTFTEDEMNNLYNNCDCTINIASNEGFGLSSLQSIAAGTMVINNQTGGLIDQSQGQHCIKIEPKVRILQGSVETPYIFDDLVDSRDLAEKIKYVYNLKKEERKRRGIKGVEFVKNNFDIVSISKNFFTFVTELINEWKPKHKFENIKI